MLLVAASTLLSLIGVPGVAWAQNAELSGVVRDSQGAVVPRAEVRLVDEATGVVVTRRSNDSGTYVFPSIKPSTYTVQASASGFAQAEQAGFVLSVDQRAVLDVTLTVEGRSEVVEVTQRAFVGSVNGSVGTLIDRKFAESLPVRGRSFSALVRLTPGVVTMPVGSGSGSEFSVNGQRTTANSLTVDGVSGLAEMDSGGFRNAGGQRFSSTVTGTVNGGISMESLQEVRVQTSSFAAEFGRTPGGQISLVTRSGTNSYHGAVFEQFRDDSLAANEWFANAGAIGKLDFEEHQFGGSFGGPIARGRTFGFFSYEGIRLDLPRLANATVPSRAARALDPQRILNAFPEPTGPDRANLTAEYIAAHRIRYDTDTWGARVDHNWGPGIQMFGRYSRGPSNQATDDPYAANRTLDKLSRSFNGGITATLGNRLLLDARASYGSSSYTYEGGQFTLDHWLPVSISRTDLVVLSIGGGVNGIRFGSPVYNNQRQTGWVGSLSFVGGNHHIKMGTDGRLLRPQERPLLSINTTYANVAQVLDAKTLAALSVSRNLGTSGTFVNHSLYAQDTWKALLRGTLTYGFRWDINPAPSFPDGTGPLAVTDLEPIGELKLSGQQNVALWKTNYTNIFPRLGFSYGVTEDSSLVLSGGIGIFGELEGTAARSNAGVISGVQSQNVPIPLTASAVAISDRPNISPPYTFLYSFTDPSLDAPKTTQWNVAVERMLPAEQSVSLTYVGSRGRELLESRRYAGGVNPNFPQGLTLITSTGRSRHHALQAQYRRRSARGLHVLASYTLAKSLDTTSTTDSTDRTGLLEPSNFDLRHSFSGAASWTIQGPAALYGALQNWSVNLVTTARSGYPFTMTASTLALPGEEQFQKRASLVPGVPIVVDDASAPGGSRFNRDAFTDPSAGAQGDTGRNAFRGFGAFQIDASLKKSFSIPRGIRIDFGVDLFNLLNQPAFALPQSSLASNRFGVPTETTAGTGSTSLYQVGGPRTVAITTRLNF